MTLQLTDNTVPSPRSAMPRRPPCLQLRSCAAAIVCVLTLLGCSKATYEVTGQGKSTIKY
jgi:hypothetical protein